MIGFEAGFDIANGEVPGSNLPGIFQLFGSSSGLNLGSYGNPGLGGLQVGLGGGGGLNVGGVFGGGNTSPFVFSFEDVYVNGRLQLPNGDVAIYDPYGLFGATAQGIQRTRSTVNGLAVATAAVPAAVFSVGALASAGTMEVAVGAGDSAASPIHVAYSANGTWLNAMGRQFFKMRVTRFLAPESAATAWRTFKLPVLFPDAVAATEGCSAWSCVTAAIHAAAKGWGWPF